MQTDERPDELLCTLAAAGNRCGEETLVRRYNRLVRACARPFFLAGGDSEDLLQEGMVGLLKAIREYDSGRGVPFRSFAELCIRSSVLTAVRAAGRDKHLPLNLGISLETPHLSSPGQSALETTCLRQDGPEEALISREEWQERLSKLRSRLSGFETQVLELYLRGFSYQEISLETGRPVKSVDNAVQRIRRKTAL